MTKTAMVCRLKRNTRAQRPIPPYDSAQDATCRETETKGGQYSAFCAVNFQQLQLTNSMVQKETGQPRAVQSIQWLWVSFIFHATYPRKTVEHQRRSNPITNKVSFVSETHTKQLEWLVIHYDSSTHCLAEIFCNVTPYIPRTEV